ncbi:MAG: hypothetical protein LQ346_008323 [Caloplaca aetnensis]|nr:MAG: hypothetical protein LQ346_008323 [Caloplaca aetnensis]
MPPHLGQQRMSPPLPGGLGNPGHEFDTTILRKEKDTYEGYNFERINPQQPNEKATWALVTKTRMPLSQSELLAMVNKQKRKGASAWQLLKSDEMRGFKRKQVDRLIEDRMTTDPRFHFELAGLKLDQYNDKRGGRGTSAFQVILRRHVRKELTSAGPAGLGKLRDSHREVVDLTGGSEDPSEGSSRGFFGGHSPPLNHFVPPPPHHGFPDHHGFGQQHHQPPLVHHPGPPMHEVHHEAHRGSSPPHHLPQFGDTFIRQEPHTSHPSPPFQHHVQLPTPPMPPIPPLNAPREKHSELNEGKQKKHSKDSHSKPKIHQVNPHKPEEKHEKAPSESDWDYFSESSGSSQAYTDRTPDTGYSSNSSRKDKKPYHKGKDSRQSSRSHHDDYRKDRDDRNEPVYRVHRRKPTVSPDRSRPTGHSRHEVEEVEVIPATHIRDTRPYFTRSRTSAHRLDLLPEAFDRAAFDEVEVIPATHIRDTRPYLTRSRTSTHRPDRLLEHYDRPTFHSRHRSYEDDHQRLRGPTPPGRRASVYAPKRTTALDLYDAREQQERIERDDIRRELLREERRREEVRESVARQLEREAEEMRRPLRRDRGLSSDRLYDERPGRSSRGYDNERFMY